MNPKLLEAAREGDINQLEILLSEDNYILERSCLNESAETILHIAVLAGQREFVKKVVEKKPDLATRLNQHGFNALHIASANGFVEIATDLLKFNPQLGRLRSSDGRTALHFSAVNGNVGVIKELLHLCPSCKDDLTLRGETALLLAVKNSQFEAFKVMVEMLKQHNVEELLNVGDEDGNTVLHYAAAKSQIQTLRFLLDNEAVDGEKIKMTIKNKNGLTAVDVFNLVHKMVRSDFIDNYEVKELLQRAGVTNSTDNDHNFIVQVSNPNSDMQRSGFSAGNWCAFWEKEIRILNPEIYFKNLAEEVKKSTQETRNALLIVATLIATLTYQPILNPPGDIYTDEEDATSYANISTVPLQFFAFMVPNSIGFFASIAVINLMIHRFPLSSLLGLAVRCMAASYICGFLLIGPTSISSTNMSLLIVGCIVLVDIARFIYHVTRKCYNQIKLSYH